MRPYRGLLRVYPPGMVFWLIVAAGALTGLTLSRQGWVTRISAAVVGAGVGLVSALAYVQLV